MGSIGYDRYFIKFEAKEGREMAKPKPLGYWTKERCIADARKYSSRNQWRVASGGAYKKARRKRWLDECCAHMDTKKSRPVNYWTLEKCLEVSKNYSYQTEWLKNDAGSYDAAYRNGWLEQCCAHMRSREEVLAEVNTVWTLEAVQADALRFSTKKEWREHGPKSYDAAKRHNWVSLCDSHMVPGRKPNNYWTFERIQEEALKYRRRSDWQRAHPSSFAKAQKMEWLDLVCGDMLTKSESLSEANTLWTKEMVEKRAAEFQSIKDWREQCPNSYAAAKSRGWVHAITENMERVGRPDGYWTKERCLESAMQYSVIVDWQKGDGYAYSASKHHGWYAECTAHMEYGDSGFDRDKPATLYIASHKLKYGKMRVNVGITNRSFQERYSVADLSTVQQAFFIESKDGRFIQKLEAELLDEFADCLDPGGLNLDNKKGTKECLKADFDEVVEAALDYAA